MKRLFTLFTIFLASHLFSQKDDWQLLGTANLHTYYYKAHSRNKAWIKTESKQLEYIDNKGAKKVIDGYQMNLWQYDCDERQIGIIQLTTYDKLGSVVGSYSKKSYEIELEYVNPNSMGEYFVNVFCER